MAASDWAPAVGAGTAAVVALGTAVWIQARAWRAQERTRWDERTLSTYAEFLQAAGAAYDAAYLIARDQPDPADKCVKQFKSHYASMERHYEAIVLLAPTSRAAARAMMWTLWNLGEQALPESRDLSLATRTYRDARFHLRVAAQERFGLDVSGPGFADECDGSVHESPLAHPAQSSGWHSRTGDLGGLDDPHLA